MKTKIRFFINTLGGGGAEKVLADLLNKLDPNLFDICLVTVDGGVHKADLPKYVRHRQLIRNSDPLGDIKRKIISHLPKSILAKLYFREKFDYDIAYLEGFPTRVLAAVKTGAKKIAFVHCDLSVHNLLEPYYGSNRECLEEYDSFDRVCFVSEKCLNGFNVTFGELGNSCVVHNVIDVEKVVSRSLEPCGRDFAASGKKLVTVGRLTLQKNYSMLLRVIKSLEDEYDFELWILGDGEQREELETQIAESGIRSVKLLGFQTNPHSFCRKADLFVCSSLFEGYSTAVSEALALGLPTLTTDCAGMREILDNGKYGLIVENSEEGLRNGLVSFLNNDEIWSDISRNIQTRDKYDSDGALKEFFDAIGYETA